MISFSVFPDCSLCHRQADDGGWLDNKNYRFWICIDCDDWLDILPQPEPEMIKRAYNE